MSLLIERLAERAHSPGQATDDSADRASGKGKTVAPRATAAQIAAAEEALGFHLPGLLCRLYLDVGNGSFGPGSGLRGVPTSAEDGADSIVTQYQRLRNDRNSPTWPKGLLPLCEWGSGILSAVDCTYPAAPVIRVDPNMPRADVAARVPAALHYDRAAEVGAASWTERASLEEWLEAWADGARLFYAAYGGNSTEEDAEEDQDDDSEDES